MYSKPRIETNDFHSEQISDMNNRNADNNIKMYVVMYSIVTELIMMRLISKFQVSPMSVNG